ncbi:MAG: hypothetical protein ACI4OS_02055 [Akkermansia sp.]
MSTSQWNMVDAQIRERAFFMAGVDNARILSSYRQTAAAIAAGRMSEAEGRRRIREQLAAIGYAPTADDVGTLQDLSSRRRLDVALQTNVNLARGWAERRANLGDLTHPGQELYRQRRARVPRDWTSRWAAAAAAVNWEGVARGGAFIALLTSPIWVQLSRFGYPYPPFDFGSGMRVRPVSYQTCKELGLLDDDWIDRQRSAATASLNEGCAVDCSDLQADVMEELERALGSVGKITGGVAVMRDVNGTTPYTAAELARVVGVDTPEGVPNVQRAAAELWADAGADGMPPAAKEAMRALLQRTRPEQGVSELQKAFELSAEQAEAATAALERDGYAVPRGMVAEAWESTAAAAMSAPVRRGTVRVLIKWREPQSARNLQPLLRQLGREPENALQLIAGHRLRVVDKTERAAADGGRIITYTVRDDAAI